MGALPPTSSFREEQPGVRAHVVSPQGNTNLVFHRQTHGLPMTGVHVAFQPTRQGTCVHSCLEKPLSLHAKVTHVPYPSTLFRSYFWKNVESHNSNKRKILPQPTQTCVWNMLQKNRNVCEFEIPAPELSSAYSWALWKRVKGVFPEAPHFGRAFGDCDCDWAPKASLEGHTDKSDNKT